MKRFILNFRLVGFLFIALAVSGCSNVRMIDAAPPEALTENELKTEMLSIRNCAHNSTVAQTTLAAEAPVRQEVIFLSKAVAVETGQMVEIPVEVQDQLSIQIMKVYEQLYQEITSKNEAVNLEIPAFRIHFITVKWLQQCACSDVIFKMDNKTYTADYSYHLEYPEKTDTQEMACTA